MKKRLIAFLAIIFVISFVFASCGDKFSGNYKEITPEQKEEYAEKLSTAAKSAEKKSLKEEVDMTYSYKDSEGNEESYDMSGTALLDLSDANNKKVSYDVTMSQKGEKGTTKVTMKVAYAQTDNKVYLDITVKAPEKDDYSTKGYVNGLSSGLIDNLIPEEIADVDFDQMVQTIVQSLKSAELPEGTKVSVDGDKIKMEYEQSGMKGELYFVVDGDNLSCKATEKGTATYGKNSQTIDLTMVLETTSETVKLPSYDKEINMTELAEAMSSLG